MRKLFSLFFLFALVFHATISLSQTPTNPEIRVSVLTQENDIQLSVRGKYKIYDTKTDKLLHKGISLRNTPVKFEYGKIKLGNKTYRSKSIRIRARRDFTLFAKDLKRQYRGNIVLAATKNSKVRVINILGLERYVKGVLYLEITDRWPMEAMKAQAIAVRTYAMYQINERVEQDYDVTSDIYSQVYGGKDTERYRTSIAANRTKEKILKYDGKILPAYFHSNSGGHTENVSELWKHNNVDPLNGVLDEYAQYGPNFNWTQNYRSKEIQDQLNQAGYAIGLIKEIRVKEKTQSGRNKTIEITARDGKKLNLDGNKFREIVGPNKIKSNLYDITMKGYFFDLTGHGWGHGVGMCQWGAHAMAERRFNHTEILEYYYPKADITHL